VPAATLHRTKGLQAAMTRVIVRVIMDVIYPWFFGVTMRPYKCGHLNNRPR